MYTTALSEAYLQGQKLSLLHGKNLLQPKVSEIITDFLKEQKENYVELINNLSQYKIFSNKCILIFFQRFTAQLKGEVSTSRALFILCSKPIRSKRTLNP